MINEKVASAKIGTEVYRTTVSARNHVLIADEPQEDGGKNLGPRPGDFLRMSLASCTAITLRMYANRKKFDIEQIDVTVSSEEADGGTRFSTRVEIKGNLDDAQRQRMLQIAKLCPVHKALTNPIAIDTQLDVVLNPQT